MVSGVAQTTSKRPHCVPPRRYEWPLRNVPTTSAPELQRCTVSRNSETSRVRMQIHRPTVKPAKALGESETAIPLAVSRRAVAVRRPH